MMKDVLDVIFTLDIEHVKNMTSEHSRIKEESRKKTMNQKTIIGESGTKKVKVNNKNAPYPMWIRGKNNCF